MKLSIFVSLCLFVINAQAIEKIIYGDESRVVIQEILNPNVLEISNSIAAMIPKNMTLSKNGVTYSYAPSLKKSMNLCPEEKFSKLPSAAYCTGFLVGDKYLVTAGHCITNQTMCDNVKWVFNYKQKTSINDVLIFDDKNVYNCKKVIKAVFNEKTLNDYSVIELERKVIGRSPVKLSTKNQVSLYTEVYTLGHPSGLPLIFTGEGFIVKQNSVYFTAAIDTFGGNSGSPVFDSETNTVLGILVRGGKDYVLDKKNKCFRVNQCQYGDGNCRGEQISHIAPVAKIVKKLNETRN